MTEWKKEQIEKIRHTLWGFFIIRRPIAWLIILGSIIFGLSAVQSMPKEVQPEIRIPIGAVSTALPGANPSDTESLITKPIEDQIANIDDIKSLTSTSGFGSSSVVVEFEASVDMDKAIQDIKDAVDLVKPELPEDATDPVVIRAEANSFSIISFSLSGDRPLHEITEIGEDIADELETISGVSRVDITGGQKKQIHITVDQKKAEGYGLSLQDISNIIDLSNTNLPVGIISSDKKNYSVRIDNRYQSISEIANIPILTTQDENNTTILLKDIAKIEEAYPPQSVISKFAIGDQESKKAVTLQIYKKDDADILSIVDEAKLRIEELKGTIIPDDINIGVSNDNSIFIRTDLGILTKNGIQTTILITVILFLALGLRQGIIAGLSMPIIFLITFVALEGMGMTINSLSLFSLVIALGLMVDTTIVIMEGIHENLREGFTPEEAALISVDTYKWPLIAGTMTTIFAFFPMLLVSGILGEFLRTLPITISAALFSSLFISLTVAPSIATGFLKAKHEKKRSSILEPIFDKLGAKFEILIDKIVKKGIVRFFVVMLSLVLFAASLFLPISGALQVEMFPKTDIEYFIVQIETPKGTVLEKTEEVTGEIEKIIQDQDYVKNIVTNIGTDQSVGLADDDFVPGGTSRSNIANVTVNLVPEAEREVKSYVIAENFRKAFENYTKAKVTIQELSEGPPSDAPIALRITGADLEVLKELSEKVESIIDDIPESQNIESTYESGLSEFKFNLDRDKLAYHGLSAIQVSSAIRNIVQGIESTTVTFEGEDIDLIVKYNLQTVKTRTNISVLDIENFEIASPKGYTVSLGQIGNYDFTESLSSINREDQKRIIQVNADLEVGANSVEITNQLEENLKELEVPSGYDINFGGDFEEINESFQDLFQSMIIGIILIAFTLVLMFNSFRQTLIILFALPLALIGVFPGLMLVGLKLSFPAFLGVVALSGVVVNDAIVLIDRINTNRKTGMKFRKSIAEATQARLQPIIMTSITTIVGILPLAISNEFWAGLGFSLIFGLAFSTLLTLFVIPVLYYFLEVRRARKSGEVVELN